MLDAVEMKEKPGACVACGNSPTNHRATYWLNTIAIWMAPVVYPFYRSRAAGYFVRFLSYAQHYFSWVYYGYSYLLFIIRYNKTDKDKCITYRSQVVWEEAERRGIQMEQVKIYGRCVETYRAHLNTAARIHWPRTIYFDSLPIPPHLTTANQQWIDDKWYLKHVLRSAGIAVPVCESVTTADEARAALRTIGAPVITKPRLGTRGRHVETYITNEHDLLRGFTSAQVLCRYVCVEKHLAGSVCRGTVVHKKLRGFFEAKPIAVTGDGVSTIRTLVEKKNAARHERVHAITLNDEHSTYVGKQGYTLDSVVPNGHVVPLTHRTGRLFGGETRELLDSVHPNMRAYMERAAEVIDVPIVGFDLIIGDPEADPDTQEWGILEANAVPFIDLHYLPLYGTPSLVAKDVWDLWGTAQ